MVGIDQELRMREMAVGGNPQVAQQRYAQSKSLMDLLVAQKVSNDYASARNAIQAATQAPAGTVKDQLDMSNAQVTKNDMMRSVMPGVRMKAARDQQAMQRQAMGIPTQPAPNIRMADGGIVGYEDGGVVGYKDGGTPTPGAVPPKAADPQDIIRMADLYRQAQASLKAATNPEDKAKVQEILNDLKTQMGDQLPFVMQYLDSTKGIIEPRTQQMAEGGIAGFKEGNYVGGITGPMGIYAPGINKTISFAEFLAGKGIGALSDVSEAAGRQLVEEFIEQKSAGDRRTELAEMADAPGSEGARQAQPESLERPYISTGRPSVASSQMENLAGVTRAGASLLREGAGALPSPSALFEGIASPPSAGEREATEAQREGRRRGLGAMLEGIASLAPEGESELQKELKAAERRMQAEQREAERAARGPQPYVLSDLAKGAGLEGFFSGIPSFEEMYPPNPEDASLAYKVGSATRALRTPFQVLSGFLQPKDEDQLTFSDIGPIASEFTAGLTGAEMPTQQTDEEIAQEIIDTGVTEEQYRAATVPAASATPAIDRGAIDDAANALAREVETTPAIDRGAIDDAANALAREVETTPSGAEGAARAASVITGRASEADVTQLASTLAQNPTPENTSRFESEIQRLMERRESPMRALSDFLISFSQARGGSMGQNLAIAMAGIRAVDDALDKQIVELEKLRSAEQISERDFQLEKDRVESDSLYREAMTDYYSNIESSRLELQELVNQGRLEEARQKLRTELISAGMNNMRVYQMQARAADRNADASTINDRAMALLQQDIIKLINTFIPNAGGSQFTEGQTATNAQGEKIVFRNGNWETM